MSLLDQDWSIRNRRIAGLPTSAIRSEGRQAEVGSQPGGVSASRQAATVVVADRRLSSLHGWSRGRYVAHTREQLLTSRWSRKEVVSTRQRCQKGAWTGEGRRQVYLLKSRWHDFVGRPISSWYMMSSPSVLRQTVDDWCTFNLLESIRTIAFCIMLARCRGGWTIPVGIGVRSRISGPQM